MRCLLLAWVLVVLGAGPETPVQAGERFADLLAAGRYAEARAMFDEEMTRVCTLSMLESSWTGVTARMGPLVKTGPAVMQKVAAYDVVLIPCHFERGRYRLKVVLDSKRRVSGYFWLAYQSGTPPGYLKNRVSESQVSVGPWKLPGLLGVPKDVPVRAGLVLVAGSGPNDKDETIGGSKPFRDLARGLAGYGVVTLRYDKRTRTYGLAMALTRVGVEQEVLEDAVAALALLRSRPELKGKPVLLLGHSLGGLLAPEIARRDGRVDGLVLLAAPARGSSEILVEQLTYVATFDPANAPTILEMAEKARRLDQLSDSDTLLSAPVSYWREVDRFQSQSLQVAAALPCPVLVMQGGRDYQVTRVDLDRWKQALAGHRGARFHLFPRLNHLFAPGEGKARPMEYEDENYVDPVVIQVLGEWIASVHSSKK
ncbi:MAG: DUF3887 domain-containing protein [Candidatus Eremiobacterota bacterium]